MTILIYINWERPNQLEIYTFKTDWMDACAWAQYFMCGYIQYLCVNLFQLITFIHLFIFIDSQTINVLIRFASFIILSVGSLCSQNSGLLTLNLIYQIGVCGHDLLTIQSWYEKKNKPPHTSFRISGITKENPFQWVRYCVMHNVNVKW